MDQHNGLQKYIIVEITRNFISLEILETQRITSLCLLLMAILGMQVPELT